MVNVPNPPQPGVRPAALPAIRTARTADISTFGGGQAAGSVFEQARGIAADVFKFKLEERKKNDQVAVLEADLALGRLENQVLYDQQGGALTARGKNAIGAQDRADRAFREGFGKIEKGLANGSQKAMFRRNALMRQATINRAVQRHVSVELLRHDNQTTESYLQNEENASALNYEDDARIAISVARSQAAILDHAERNGLDNETTKRLLQESRSRIHSLVIAARVSVNEDVSASTYLDKNKGEMLPRDLQVARQSVEESSLRGESQRTADEAMGANLSEEDTIERARTVGPPKFRDMLVARIKDRFAEKRRLEQQVLNQNYKNATQLVDDNPLTPPEIAVPTPVWNGLSTTQQAALRRRRNPTQNDRIWLDFVDLNRTKPGEVAKMDRSQFETRYRMHFDLSRQAQAEAMWSAAAGAARRDAASQRTHTELLSASTVVDNELKRVEIIPWTGKLTNDQAALQSQFLERVTDDVQVFEREELQRKRKATVDEIQTIARKRLTRTVMIDRTFPIPNKEFRVADILTEELGLVFVPLEGINGKNAIQPAQLQSIKNQLRSRGTEFTDWRAQRLWGLQLTDTDESFEEYERVLNGKD